MTVVNEIWVGYELPTITRHITQEKMTLFVNQLRCRASIDGFHTQFGIHYSEEFAKSKGLPSTVAQALQYYAYAAELMTNFFGEEWFTGGKMEMSFIKAVYPRDTLSVKGVVREIMPEEQALRIVIDIWCENQNKEKVGVGIGSGLRKKGVS